MVISVQESEEKLGAMAAEKIACLLRETIQEKGEANLLLSTGASQFTTLGFLVTKPVDWTKVTMFHLDEYVGLSAQHKASFRKYLRERFTEKVPLKRAVFVGASEDVQASLDELNREIKEHPIDVGVIGIGENGHIAFNDPPADFQTKEPYHVVALNEACKRQQVGEGWFESIDDVPTNAISMTPYQIMCCRSIVSPVPGQRKARAIRDTLKSSYTDPMIPATLLKEHPAFFLFLDKDSASMCSPSMLQQTEN